MMQGVIDIHIGGNKKLLPYTYIIIYVFTNVMNLSADFLDYFWYNK